MSIYLSVAIRIFYASMICAVTIAIGIGVAMGFDAGVSIGAIVIVTLYFITFIPAIIISFIPISILSNPPTPLKLWYYWIGLLVVLITLYRGIALMTASYNDWGKAKDFTLVCFLTDAASNRDVWFDLASSNNDFHRSGGVPRKKGELWCGTYGYSLSPMRIRAYSATDSNKGKYHAVESDDDVSEVISVDLRTKKKVCISLSQLNEANHPRWSVAVVDCESKKAFESKSWLRFIVTL